MTPSPPSRKRRSGRSTRKSGGTASGSPRTRGRRRAPASKKAASKRAPIRAGQGRHVASSFWAEAWCKNLAGHAELAHRLPRGMELVHEGAVVDLQIGAGRVTALVRGADAYRVFVTVAPLAAHRWSALTHACAGGVGSLEGLLEGFISQDAQAIVTRRDEGFFPAPSEIQFDCSCPDPAKMCEHIAAVLFGIGVRIAGSPDLLFALRRVDPADMVTSVDEQAAERSDAIGVRVLTGVNLSELFGIEIDDGSGASGAEPAKQRTRRGRGRGRGRSRSRSRRKPAAAADAATAEGTAAEAKPSEKPDRRRRRRRRGRKPAEASEGSEAAAPARPRRRRRRRPKPE